MIEHIGEIRKAFTSKWDGYCRSTCIWKKVFWTKKCIQVVTEHLDLLDEYSRWSNRKKDKSSQESFHARKRNFRATEEREINQLHLPSDLFGFCSKKRTIPNVRHSNSRGDFPSRCLELESLTASWPTRSFFLHENELHFLNQLKNVKLSCCHCIFPRRSFRKSLLRSVGPDRKTESQSH